MLILDEPTNGLDPAGIRELREFIHKLVKEENMSVFISSHLLSEVQMICDRVAIIHKGKMITVATIEELIKTASDRVEWTVTPIGKAKDMLEDAEEVRVSVEGERLLCRMDVASISSWNKYFVENGINVHSVKELVFTLEDLFIELTRGERMRELRI